MDTHSPMKVSFQVSVRGCSIISWKMGQKMMMPSAPSRRAGVGGLDAPDEGGGDVGAVLPTGEHLDALADELGGVASHLFDRLAEGEDVSRARLCDGGGLGQGEYGGAVGLDALLSQTSEGSESV